MIRFLASLRTAAALEHWDQSRFTDEFIRRTHDQFSAFGRAWTPDTEQTLRVLAPRRWRDVRTVLAAASVLSR